MSVLVLLLISLIANMFSALSGGGAGLLQLPALIFLGLPFSIALATHKVATVALGIGATVRHLKEDSLARNFVIFILTTGVPGVIIGANIILHIPGRIAEISLGFLTLGLGIYSVLKPELGQTNQAINRNPKGYAIGGVVLFFIGILNGSLTSGTGLFVTLWLIRWFGMDYKTAIAYTLLLVGTFWNGSGALVLAFIAEIHWPWIPALIIGSLIGGYLGAHIAIEKGSALIKRSFEIITFLVGLKLIAG